MKFQRALNKIIVRRDACLRAERKHLQCLPSKCGQRPDLNCNTLN